MTKNGLLSVQLAPLFGLRIAELRKEKHLTQVELAHRANVNRNEVSCIEQGTYSPNLVTVFHLAYALEISPSELLRPVQEEISKLIIYGKCQLT